MDSINHRCLHCSSTESPTIGIHEIRFLDNGVPISLVDCYKTITGIKIETTSTNNKVCRMCQFQLKNAYTFKQKFKSQIIEQTTTTPPLCLIPKVEIKVENEKAYKESVFVSALTNKNIQKDKQSQSDTLLKVKSEKVTKNSKNQSLECGQEFTNSLGYHTETIHNPNNKMFVCNFCGKEFKGKSPLNEHFRIYHSKEMFGKWTDMDKHKRKRHSTSTNDKTRPLDTKNVCLVCYKSFTRTTGLSYHLETVHNLNCAKLICNFCGFQTKYKSCLRKHFREKHSESLEVGATYTYKPKFYKVGTANDHGGCVVCGKAYPNDPNNYYLYRHQKAIHIVSSTGENEGKWRKKTDNKFQCPECGIVLGIRSQPSHMRTHQIEFSFQCELCQRVFKDAYNLNLHIERYHTGKQTLKKSIRKLHRCECGNTYKNVTVLTRHKLTHSETAKFNCSLCAALFQTSEAVTSHMRKAHAETYFKCPVLKCNSMLPSQEALDAHASLHNEISACECLVCIKSFSNFYELYHHYQVHHKKTGKIYKKGPTDNCKCQCGLKFATITLIKFHNIFVHGMKISKICLICHKNFRKMETYQAHLRTHDDDQAKRQCMNS